MRKKKNVNKSSENLQLSISDILPSELYCKEYTVQNGENTNNYNTSINSISVNETVPSDDDIISNLFSYIERVSTFVL